MKRQPAKQRTPKKRGQRKAQRARFVKRGQQRPASAHQHRAQAGDSNCFDAPEVWHEPSDDPKAIRFIRSNPGKDHFHPISTAEAKARIEQLPKRFVQGLDVVQFSKMTKKRAIFPVYGMQWGSTVYLYPIEDSLTEVYSQPPNPQVVIDTKMYGGKWSQDKNRWTLTWTRETIRDYYLNNILIHEVGHINDERNTSYRDREAYANWFAIEYGFKRSSRPR
ncbi:MAG: hypothetical protein AB8G99_16965 [Planctomycetaceae bacterium]